MSSDRMTNDNYNARLEEIAKLIETTAKTPTEAARIVREFKITVQTTEKKPLDDFFQF